MRAAIASFGLLTLLVPAVAESGLVTFGVDSSTTSSTLFGGDRRLDQLGFVGSSSLFGTDSMQQWHDGVLRTNDTTFGWTDPMVPDARHDGPNWWVNPDRADASTLYPIDDSGRLSDVFGPTAAGWKNLSWILDGEGNRAWTLDLLYGDHRWLEVDDDDSTVELALIERGLNSDFNVYGLHADGSTTEAVFVPRRDFTPTGWMLDTLEIGRAQSVGGIGLSLDSSWSGIVGIRLESGRRFGGPDLVGVASSIAVPGPGAAALLVLGVACPRRRRP